MFVFTAKLNRRVLLVLVLLLGLVMASAIVMVSGSRANGNNGTDGAAERPSKLSSNADRVQYLNSFGWEVDEEPVEVQDIVVPRELDGVYAEYGELQLSQGFDLSFYAGESATRYTYRVLNYPDADGDILADLVICRNVVIAGDVLSPEIDGFMHGLELPD